MAHICAAMPGGARYDCTKTNEQNRKISNLFVICAICHTIIDDLDNVKKYSVSVLRGYKKAHELRLKKAQVSFLKKNTDYTGEVEPTFPKNLKKLSKCPGYEEMKKDPDEILGIRKFVTKIREVSVTHRHFALDIAKKMKRMKVEKILSTQIQSAFNMNNHDFGEIFRILEQNHILDVDHEEGTYDYYIYLIPRDTDCCPWTEILDFCEHHEVDKRIFIEDLDFRTYD